MTDTAKPTPGPWTAGPKQADESVNVNSGILHIARVHQGAIANAVANAALITEAGTVFHETGFTPRQLLEQRDELLSVVQNIGVYGCGMLSQPAALQVSEEKWAKMRAAEMESVARDVYFKIVGENEAALAKGGKVGVE